MNQNLNKTSLIVNIINLTNIVELTKNVEELKLSHLVYKHFVKKIQMWKFLCNFL